MKKNTIIMLITAALLLLVNGCLSDDSVVGVQDEKGNVTYVHVTSFDETTGIGTAVDTATGTVYTGQFLNVDGDSAQVVTPTGDTLDFKIVSIDPGTPIPVDTTIVPVDTAFVPGDTSTLVTDTTDTVLVTPSFLNFSGPNFAFLDSTKTMDAQLQALGFEATPRVYPAVADPDTSVLPSIYTLQDGLVTNYTINEYTFDEGRAYVLNGEMVILFPNTIIYPLGLTGTVRDSATLIKMDIAFEEDRTNSVIDFKTTLYGSLGSYEALMQTVNLGTGEGIEVLASYYRTSCSSEGNFADNDGLDGHRDPACGVPLGPDRVGGGTYNNMAENSSGCHDWYKGLRTSILAGEWVGTAPYFFDALKVNPSENLDTHFTNNPFKWFSYFLYGSFPSESSVDLSC